MAINLEDLVDSLKREVAPPGQEDTLYPDSTDAMWVGRLADAFWAVVLDGLITGYTSNGETVTPVSGTTDLGRDFQALIVFWAAVQVVRTQLLNGQSVFRAKAGPVEYETQQAASVLKALLDDLTRRRNLLLIRLGDIGAVDSYYVDMVIARTESINYGDTGYDSATQGYNPTVTW